MIKQLATILKPGDTVSLILSREGEGLRLNILPKLFTLDGEKSADRQALNQPLTVTGSAEEFDSPSFLEEVTKFTHSIAGLTSTLDEAEKVHAEAKAASDKKKPAKPAPKPVIVKSAPKPPVKLPARPTPGKAKPSDAGQVASSAGSAAPSPVTPPVTPVVPAATPKPATALEATESLI